MFKNLLFFRTRTEGPLDVAQLSADLEAQRFVPCGPHEEKTIGWIEPRGHAHGPLLEQVAGQLILKLKMEAKSVPASVVMRKAKERAAQIEASTGRKPGKKELRELKEDVRLSLLPLAFSKESTVWVWLDPQAGCLALDAGSQARADEAITLLVKSLNGLNVAMVHTQTSPSAAMAEWLVSQEPPAGFSVDRDCELKAADESKAVVRYARHALDTDEVKQHVQQGKLPTRLAMTWEGRVSFMLTEGLQLKKLAFVEGVFDDSTASKEDRFDTDVAITTGELGRLLPDLVAALGGEVPLS